MSELREIAPAEGSKDGWHYKCHLRIGQAKIARRERGGFELYGLYGARWAAGDGWELFTQHEGHQDADGGVYGKTLLASSMDSDPYIWCPAEWFTEMTWFGVEREERS